MIIEGFADLDKRHQHEEILKQFHKLDELDQKSADMTNV